MRRLFTRLPSATNCLPTTPKRRPKKKTWWTGVTPKLDAGHQFTQVNRKTLSVWEWPSLFRSHRKRLKLLKSSIQNSLLKRLILVSKANKLKSSGSMKWRRKVDQYHVKTTATERMVGITAFSSRELPLQKKMPNARKNMWTKSKAGRKSFWIWQRPPSSSYMRYTTWSSTNLKWSTTWKSFFYLGLSAFAAEVKVTFTAEGQGLKARV